MQTGPRPYYKFSDYLKQRFHCRVHKVSVDAGFSCPNRDGKISQAGCIYCDNRSFSFNARKRPLPLEAQIQQGIAAGRSRFKAKKFMVYFQAFTNTYAPLKVLRARYDVIRKFRDIVGLAIGTRPDCVDDEVLDLIAGYTRDYEVWLEYGLQSIHQKSLALINRGHLYADFLRAQEATRKRAGIKICAHVILGLPGETRKDVLATAREIARLRLDGVKIHPLHILQDTQLEQLLRQGRYQPLELGQYVDLVSEFLQYLWPQTVIQRITADAPGELLMAPLWMLEKNTVLKQIDEALRQKSGFQGSRFTEHIKSYLKDYF